MLDDTIARWEQVVSGADPAALDGLLAPDVLFYSPVVYTPQRGAAVTAGYLRAAAAVLGGTPDVPFRYTKRVLAGDTAVLEFETSLSGRYVNGVDIIRCDDDGAIVEFRVMLRPLQAIHAVHEAMAAALAAATG